MRECREIILQNGGNSKIKIESCLIVSGDALHAIMFDMNLKDLFLDLVGDCQSLISFRMSPK